MNGVGDVLHMIRTFSDIYGQRYGAGCQAPEAGIRVQTIRVAAYVDGDVVQFESLEYGRRADHSHADRHRTGPLRRGETAPVDTPIYDAAALAPPET